MRPNFRVLVFMVMFIVIASINRQTNPSLAFFADHDFAPLPFC